jgi:PAS domain S-box-containing protein
METNTAVSPRLTVLVIDDERIVRTSLAVYLEDTGYRVLEAGNGLEGIKLCRTESPDIVFTDLRMPGLDGFGVVERLSIEFPETPVVVISGAGNISEAVQALRLGAWDYITKPIEDLDVIDITSRRVLERARLMRENREYRQQLELLVEERTRQLAESEERYRQLFLQHEDAIMLCAADSFHVVEVNPAFMELFGYYSGDIMGRPAAQFFPENIWDEIRKSLVLLANKEFLFYEQLSAVDHNGATLTISFKGWLVAIGRRSFFYFSMRNISEKIRLEQEIRASQARLIQANKMTSLGILLSGMAHEINNPNNFIGVNAALLADIWRDARPLFADLSTENGDVSLGGLPMREAAENGSRLIDGIMRGSARINSVVTGLKNFSRSDTSGLKDTIEVTRVIHDACTILDHHIQTRTDHFQVRCEEALPTVRGSHQQIEQVLINLLVNALQALPDRNHGVTVATSHDPVAQQIVITVADEGIGMSPEVCSRITEPFFTTRLGEGGTGLGLSISSSIIRDHGGAILFQSELGKGTVVTVRLSVAEGVTP